MKGEEMDIRINGGKVLHVIDGKGWYIDDKLVSDPSKDEIRDCLIERHVTDVDILNNPCIYVMSACNGTCQYCYQEEHLKKPTSNLTYEEIEGYIKRLNERQSDKDNKTIELFGGEPLLRKDIAKIITMLKQYNYKVLIATNGTLPILRDQEFQKLIKDNVHIRISLDGHTDKLHEMYRTPKTFATIVNNIKELRAADIDVSVKSIISDHNFPYLEDILGFVRDKLYVKSWNYNVLYKLDAYEENSINTHIDHYSMVKELCKEKYLNYFPMLKQTPLIQMLISVYVKRTKRYRRTYLFLNYDKKVYLNDQLIFPEYAIGTIDNLDFPYKELMTKYEFDRESCRGCFAKDYCYLGNYGELYKIDSSLNGEFPTCDVLRKCIVHLMCQQEQGIEMLKRVFTGEKND